jgi:hypothetical protein
MRRFLLVSYQPRPRLCLGRPSRWRRRPAPVPGQAGPASTSHAAALSSACRRPTSQKRQAARRRSPPAVRCPPRTTSFRPRVRFLGTPPTTCRARFAGGGVGAHRGLRADHAGRPGPCTRTWCGHRLSGRFTATCSGWLECQRSHSGCRGVRHSHRPTPRCGGTTCPL